MNNILKKIVWLIIIAPLVYLAIIWNSLPQQVAIHFNLSGNADRYGDKSMLLIVFLVLTAVNAGAYLLLCNIHKIDPKRSAIENKDRMQRLAFAISVFISAMPFIIIAGSREPGQVIHIKWIFAAVGLLFCVVGNYLFSIKPSYFAGFRTPWALKDENNWRKTHLLAGKLWFGGGLLIAVACIFLPSVASIICFAVITVVINMVPLIYSYNIRERRVGSGD